TDSTATQPELHLNARGYHALAALVLLDRLSAGRPVRLSSLARGKDSIGSVSQSYLEQLFSGLRRADIVRSTRGPGGGYVLSRPARDISLADIFIATTPDGTENNNGADPVQRYIGMAVYDVLSRRTLADVIRHYKIL